MYNEYTRNFILYNVGIYLHNTVGSKIRFTYFKIIDLLFL